MPTPHLRPRHEHFRREAIGFDLMLGRERGSIVPPCSVAEQVVAVQVLPIRKHIAVHQVVGKFVRGCEPLSLRCFMGIYGDHVGLTVERD